MIQNKQKDKEQGIITPKQMFQRLPLLLSKISACNNSKFIK